jgi:peptidoglycan/LPS O-acetylase OafA/YrhL
MSTQDIVEEIPAHTAAKRFYRPELDALRFFAFLAVLLHHGPRGPNFLGVVSAAGAFGLSMFFLLSAYLITELLIREREQTKTIAWGLFFIRRALRIWPLYYAALAAAVVIALIPPHRYWVSQTGIAAMSIFVANWIVNSRLGVFVGHLWSISIEEQFYLIWPPVFKFGGKTLALVTSIAFVVSAVVWLWSFSGRGWSLWYDTPVEFLFFAAGAIIAIATHSRSLPAMNGLVRGGLLIAGLTLVVIAADLGGVGTDNVPGLTRAQLYIGYGGAVTGCVLIFLAVLGMSNIPRPLIYLGRISYGLYVFHVAVLHISYRLTSPLRLANHSAIQMFVVDSVALLLCTLAAHLSYRYFERPFMKLKERFAVIQSRPA